MKTIKVQYAKTHLSALLHGAERGEVVVIARGDQPVAKLGPVDVAGERELGFVSYDVPDEFFEPLPESELAAWES
ncbi:type II toxin-antitoxin system Phd/YefM family antitoxin [Paramicrobacterium agarici]|uniref:type II toxin-antitoxin system Phd/YefM family antitoxin n=1 Tax=Paramicrobacterium agarici TaxID=630514 RepID=UPI0011517753|nr:type II toxin-antitoxin system Phd/YefM family antitoxin [Microbacterium agarici]TQO21939.1 antitoxin (DNA-binding transcriptional repressor) of toxin-antitoxin stability system [Microbacterium agarici]